MQRLFDSLSKSIDKFCEPIQESSSNLYMESCCETVDKEDKVESKENYHTEVKENMKKTLMLSEKCIQCGSCLGIGFDFLECAENGSIIIKLGTSLEMDSYEYQTLKELCPVDAFFLGENTSNKKMLLQLREKLNNTRGCLLPVAKDFPFDKGEYSIPVPISSGRSGYDYSSDDAAERAALSEFKNKMYYQVDNLILKVITEYRTKYVKPYYTKVAEEGSVYEKINSNVNTIIDGINSVLGNESSLKLSKLEVFPDDDIAWKMLNRGELLSDEMISAVKKEFNYDAETYSCNWNTDSMERPAGKDLFGNYKFKEKYCYKNLNAAYQDLARDLISALGWSKDALENRAVEVTSWLVEAYNKVFREEINKRVKILDEILSTMTEDSGYHEIVSLKAYENKERKVSYNKETQCIKVNGQELKEKECFVAGDDNLQIFFDGHSLYRRYVNKKNNVIMNEIVFPENRYDNSLLIGIGNIILHWCDDNCLYTYHVKEDKKYLIAKEVYNTACIAGNKVCYSKWDYDDRFAAKKLYTCDFNGDNKKTIDSVSYSKDILVFMNARVEDNKLKYEIRNYMHSNNSIEKEIDIEKINAGYSGGGFLGFFS